MAGTSSLTSGCCLGSAGQEGPEAIERVKAVRKRIRKNEAKRSLLEGGYGDDDEDEPDGEKAEAVEGNVRDTCHRGGCGLHSKAEREEDGRLAHCLWEV